MSLKSLRSIYDEETPVVVNFQGSQIPAVVKLDAVSAKEMTDMRETVDNPSLLALPLSKYYVSIDLSFEDDGEALPINVENLEKFPPSLLMAMLETIGTARTAKKKS